MFYFQDKRKLFVFSLCNFTGSNFTNIHYDLNAELREPIIMCAAIGLMSLISGYIRTALSNILAQRQCRTIREILFRSILNKDIVYFDQKKPGELSLYLTENVNKIQDGIGEKLASAVEMVATCIGGIVIGFVKGWKLAFAILAFSPVMCLGLAILFKVRFFY